MLLLNLFFKYGVKGDFYPAQIEKISNKKISRVGAKIVCEKLIKYGMLHSKLISSPNHSKSTLHYSLPKDAKSLKIITSMFFRTLATLDPHDWQENASSFMMSKYAQQMINSDLVREILSTKKIIAYKHILLEKRLKKSDKNYKIFPNHVSIAFPIRSSSMEISHMDPEICSKSDGTKDEKIKQVITNYYEKTEHDEIILPILYLIQISPNSLEYFLGGWEPWFADGAHSSNSMGLNSIEHVLFRLIWNTVNDLSIIRHVPTYGDISEAYVSGGNSTTLSKSLLCISCKDAKIVEYDAGFDTHWDFVGDESGNVYDVITNPENYDVCITSKML